MDRLLELIKLLGVESDSPDTIFLHRYGGGWIAFQHSALLLRRYMASLQIRKIVMGPVWLMYAELQDIELLDKNIRSAGELLSCSENPYARIIRCATGITGEEIGQFQNAADRMYLPYDETLDINPQDDSFLSKKVWDLAATPEDQFPIMHHNHLLHLYRYQVCKQADTVLAHVIFEDRETVSTIRNSFEYYEKITTHDSSLSRCIFSIMASRLGEEEKAYEYFDFSSKLDITNSQKNTKDGIHTANMGGTYMAIVYGFLGLRVKEEGYFFTPVLPRQWNSYRQRICLKGSLVDIKVSRDRTDFALLEGNPLDLTVYGKTYRLEQRLTIKGEENT